MHLIVPYARPAPEGFASAQTALRLPNLQALLALGQPGPVQTGDAFSLSPPHERVLARALELDAPDGQIPWAAWHAQRKGLPVQAGQGWAFVSLCHWQVNTGHLAMSHLPLPGLGADASDALRCAMQPFFEEDGITLAPDQPGRWLACSPVLAQAAWASTDRVVGRNLAAWLPDAPVSAPLRRLQNEMQMLLYTHPLNDQRAAQGLAPVNSFWLHGCGALPAGWTGPAAPAVRVLDALKAPALHGDAAAWRQAWQVLDETEFQPVRQALRQGQSLTLSLCGERGSRSWRIQPPGLWQSFKQIFPTKPMFRLLSEL